MGSTIEIVKIAGIFISLIIGVIALFKVFATGKVTNALQTNHIEHLKDDIQEIKKNFSDLWKEINKIKENMIDISKDISFIKGKFYRK